MNLKNIKELHYKALFIYGAYVTIIILALSGTIVDAIKGSADAYFDFGFALFSYIAYKYLCKDGSKIELAGITLFWIAAVFEYIFIFLNGADFDLIFAILIPIVAFISMSLRNIIINLTLFYAILIVILTYYYINYPTHFILHNSKYLIAYIYTHLFMVAYGFFYHLSISETVKKLEISNKQNTLLLLEIHHRVKNNLNIISSILGLQAFKIEDKEAKEAILSSRKRIESMATLHEILYKNRAQDSLNIKEYIKRLVSNTVKSESSFDKVEFDLYIEDANFSISSLIQFGIMLNELLTNSIKYARLDGEKIKIQMKFQKLKNSYILIYCDNAKEVDLKRLKNGFGYKLITLSIAHFDGDFQVKADGGLCYYITLREID